MATFHRIFPITFDDFHIFDFFFALYTNSFVRSFASSINITGSSLVRSHNRACNFTKGGGGDSACRSDRDVTRLPRGQSSEMAPPWVKDRSACYRQVGLYCP